MGALLLSLLSFPLWNSFNISYEVPAVALGRVSVDNRARMDYVSNLPDIGAANGGRMQRQHMMSGNVTPPTALSSQIVSSRRNTDPIVRVSLQPQYNQHRSQIPRSISQGAFSQGRMSRASSEAIFQRSADVGSDVDDESGSWLYFLGGEVVVRRGDNDRSSSNNLNGSGDELEPGTGLSNLLEQTMDQAIEPYASRYRYYRELMQRED